MDDLIKQFIANQERIAAALEKIAANGGGFVAQMAPAAEAEPAKPADKAKPAKPADTVKPAEPAKQPDPEPEQPAAESAFSLDEVRAALKEYRAIEGSPAMLEVLKTHGGKESLPDIDASCYAAIMEAIGFTK